MKCFEENILKRFTGDLKSDDHKADLIATALLKGDSDIALSMIREILRKFVSIRDTATKAPRENYYHGLLNGIFSNSSYAISNFRSNSESGNRYADISFENADGDIAVIIEIKVSKADANRGQIARDAISQIESQNYAERYLKDEAVHSVFAYGIAFCGKNCAIAMKELKK